MDAVARCSRGPPTAHASSWRGPWRSTTSSGPVTSTTVEGVPARSTAVDDQVDVAEQRGGGVGRLERRRAAVPVGAGGGQRPDPGGEGAHEVVVGAAHADGVLGLAERPAQVGPAGQHHGERAWPVGGGQPARRRRNLADQERTPGRRPRTARREARRRRGPCARRSAAWRRCRRPGRPGRRRCRWAARQARRPSRTCAARSSAPSTGTTVRPGHRRATRNRSRPARSVPVRTSEKPASAASRRTTSAWESPCSTTSAPPGASQSRAPATMSRMSSSPSAPARRASTGSQSAHDRRQLVGVGHVRRVGDDDADRARAAQRAAARTTTPRAAGPCWPAGRGRWQLARATARRVGRTLDGPHLGARSLDGDRQGDGPRAGAQVDDRAADRDGARRGRRRPRPRSRAAGSAPAGRRRARAGGTATARARTGAAPPPRAARP